MKVKFAILKYIPNFERNEKINIGIILHYPDTKQLDMELINKWQRVKSFDDEVDVSFLKDYVSDLKKEFTSNLFNQESLNNPFLLEDLTKYFVNKFIFEIHEIISETPFNELLTYLKKIYLYYDFSKNERTTERETKILLERFLLEKNIVYERRGAKNTLHEKYGNTINFDYKIGDSYYKLIFLTEDNYNGYVAMLKMWIMNSVLLKEEGKKMIFVLDDLIKNERTNSYKHMLEDYAKVITLQEFMMEKK